MRETDSTGCFRMRAPSEAMVKDLGRREIGNTELTEGTGSQKGGFR